VRAALAGGALWIGLTAFLPQEWLAGVAQASRPSAEVGEGERGLFVTHSGDTLHAAWLTPGGGRGWAQLVAEDGTVGPEVTTRAGTSHSAVFLHQGPGRVHLRYGALDDPGARHETTLRLEPEPGPARPGVAFSGVDSLFVVGDVHGELDTLRAVLRNAGVVDQADRWSAGRAHLVFVGDLMGRGPDVTALLWFLYALEPQAEEAGGRLHMVLGNHELMVLLADLRYVHPKEEALALAHGVPYDRMFDPRRSVLGRWILSKPAVIRIDDVLFAHGGVSTDYLGHSLQSLDDSLAVYGAEDLFYHWADPAFPTPAHLDGAAIERRNEIFWGERGIFWYRDYALSDRFSTELGTVLRHFASSVHVVGHTPGPVIREAYGGSLILTNTAPFAIELLLMARKGSSWERWRIRSTGPAVPL